MVILLSRRGRQRPLSRLHSVGMGGLQVVVLQPHDQGAGQLDGGDPGWLTQVVCGRAQPRGELESDQALIPFRIYLPQLSKRPCLNISEAV